MCVQTYNFDKNIVCFMKARFTPWTMKSDRGKWVFFSLNNLMVQLPWSSFLKNQFMKSLGPSLGVNWMWTKSNDHAPESECVEFFLSICLERTILKREKTKEKLKFDHSHVFYCLPLLFPKNYSKCIITIFLCHVPCIFLPEHLFCLSHCNTRGTMSMDNVGLKTRLLGSSNSMVTLTFFFLV